MVVGASGAVPETSRAVGARRLIGVVTGFGVMAKASATSFPPFVSVSLASVPNGGLTALCSLMMDWLESL